MKDAQRKEIVKKPIKISNFGLYLHEFMYKRLFYAFQER